LVDEDEAMQSSVEKREHRWKSGPSRAALRAKIDSGFSTRGRFSLVV